MILKNEASIFSISCDVHLLFEECKRCKYFRPDEKHFYKKGKVIPEALKITCEHAYICANVKELLDESKGISTTV